MTELRYNNQCTICGNASWTKDAFADICQRCALMREMADFIRLSILNGAIRYPGEVQHGKELIDRHDKMEEGKMEKGGK